MASEASGPDVRASDLFYGTEQKPRIRIIYTGGTMGMKPDPTGSLAPAPGFLTQRIQEMEELQDHPEMPDFEVLEYDPLLDSADFNKQDWITIAEDIERDYLEYDGFVVITGTDTMAFVASALSFMLDNLAKPVILTGSQIPFNEVFNDARRNLILSMIFASRGDFPEVCIYFHDRLLRGNRTTKANSFRLDAFDSPNFEALADVGVNITARHELGLQPPRLPFRVHKELDSNIVVVKLVPGYEDQCIFDMVSHSQKLRAIIFEIYGTGNAPSRKSGLLQAIRRATERGILVVALTQCLRGGVVLDKYAVGAALRDAGVVPGGDMTTEACATKLAYLFGRKLPMERIASILTVNLRGEISSQESYTNPVFTKNDVISRL